MKGYGNEEEKFLVFLFLGSCDFLEVAFLALHHS